jgi:hypothetical protein
VRALKLILMAALTGCVSYVERDPRVRAFGEESEFDTAAQIAAASAAESPRDALVWKMDEAAALRAQGRLKDSIRLFEEVETTFRAEEDKPGFSVTGSALTAFSNGYAEEYRAKPYDRIFASTYQALNRLESGDPAGARVSMARLRFVQEAYGSGRLYVTPKSGESKYDVAKAEADDRTKDGLSLIQEDLDGLTKGGTYDDAFSHWLQGMFFLRMGEGASDRERARKEFTAASQLNPRNALFRQELREASAPEASPARWIYVVVESGMCPEWREQRVDIPLFVVSSRVPYVSVALPAMRPSGLHYNLKLQLDGKGFPLESASRPDALIAKHFEAALPGIKAQAFTSAALKATASYLINKSSEQAANRPNSGTGAGLWSLATRIGTGLYAYKSTKADLRNWSLLPGSFEVARIAGRPGQRLSVAGHPEAGLTLPDGKVLLVSIKSTKENGPIVLRCTTLVP